MKCLLLCLILLSGIVHSTGPQEFAVLNVGAVRSGGYAFIDISPDQSVSDCTRKNQLRWELVTDTDKAILSLAIAAKTTGKKMLISLLDGDCLGDAARPNVVYLLGQ